MKYDIITIGGATEDVTLHTNEGILIDNKKDILRQRLLAFEYGAKINIHHSSSSFGGGAANAAVVSSLLGLKVACLTAVGDDVRAENIIKNFKNRRVDTVLVKRIKNYDSGLSFFIVGQDNEHICFSARGANSELRITNYELRILEKAEWLYLTSLSGEWKKTLRDIFSVKGVRIAWNPGHIQLKSGVKVIGKYLKKTDVLILNKDEAIELAVSDKSLKRKPSAYFKDMGKLIRAIRKYGPKIVVITNGAFGAHAYDGLNDYYQPVISEKKRIDTTGVGDAFGSSFVSGLIIFNGNIKKSLFLGAKNTASAIGKEGAQNGLLTKKNLGL